MLVFFLYYYYFFCVFSFSVPMCLSLSLSLDILREFMLPQCLVAVSPCSRSGWQIVIQFYATFCYSIASQHCAPSTAPAPRPQSLFAYDYGMFGFSSSSSELSATLLGLLWAGSKNHSSCVQHNKIKLTHRWLQSSNCQLSATPPHGPLAHKNGTKALNIIDKLAAQRAVHSAVRPLHLPSLPFFTRPPPSRYVYVPLHHFAASIWI